MRSQAARTPHSRQFVTWLFALAESGQKDTTCRAEVLGTRAKGAEAAELLRTARWIAQERACVLRSPDGVGSKLEKRVVKTRRVACGLISYMKMLLCFNSLLSLQK